MCVVYTPYVLIRCKVCVVCLQLEERTLLADVYSRFTLWHPAHKETIILINRALFLE